MHGRYERSLISFIGVGLATRARSGAAQVDAQPPQVGASRFGPWVGGRVCNIAQRRVRCLPATTRTVGGRWGTHTRFLEVRCGITVAHRYVPVSSGPIG